MPMRQGGRLAKKGSTWWRLSDLRITLLPLSLTACICITFVAISRPTVVIAVKKSVCSVPLWRLGQGLEALFRPQTNCGTDFGRTSTQADAACTNGMNVSRFSSRIRSRLCRHFLRNLKWIRPMSGAKNGRHSLPAAARVRPASAPFPSFASLRTPTGATTNDLTPCRMPLVLSPPPLALRLRQNKRPLRLRGGRRRSLVRCRSLDFHVLLR